MLQEVDEEFNRTTSSEVFEQTYRREDLGLDLSGPPLERESINSRDDEICGFKQNPKFERSLAQVYVAEVNEKRRA